MFPACKYLKCIASHLHLHIISSDLVSPSLKNKKHYNSFHPTAGFFLHLDDVLEWFEGDGSHHITVITSISPTSQTHSLISIPNPHIQMSELSVSRYEPLLKEDLKCWRCHTTLKNIPALKTHLNEEWEKQKQKAIAAAQKKRKRGDIAAEVQHQSAEDDLDDTRQVKRSKRPESTFVP